jgi:hypothetical protein
MPSTPPPKPAPRSGAGAFTLLAVLAFLALAAFLLMRREPAGPLPSPPPVAAASPMPVASPPAAAESPAAGFPMPDASPATMEASPTAPVAAGEPEPAAGGGTRPRRRAPASPAPGPRVADAGGMSTRLPAAPPPVPAGGRRFVLGTTVVESAKGVPRNLPGFDAAGVGVKRAPEVTGRVVLEMDPPQVRPGVDYTVKVWLANDGDKDIPVQAVKVTTIEDGRTIARNPPPGARSVKPKQRALVHEFSGVWREAARAWAMEVTVTSERQDVYRNRLSWE